MAESWRSDIIPRFCPRVEIREGEEIPEGYGIAYYECGRDAAACYPLPFNVIIGAWRAFLWHVRCPPWRLVEGRRETYRQGYADAERDYWRGYEDARQRALRERVMLERQNAAMLKMLADADALREVRYVFLNTPFLGDVA